jgi:hypothetical protein
MHVERRSGWVLISEADLRELVRDEVRTELRHHREELLEALRTVRRR